MAVAWVAGASGFVGREVVPALVARGARTIAHVRPDSSRLDDWRARFAAAGAETDTTAWDSDALAARLRAAQASVVLCLVGTTRKRAQAEALAGDIYEAVDVGLTRTLVAAAVASGRAPRIVYLSSIGASEAARSPYLAARGRAERVVTGSGLPYRIARPSIISGPGRDDARPGERTAGVVADGVLAVAGLFGGRRLRERYRSTTPEILARALVELAFDTGGDRIVDGAALRS